MVWGHGGLVVWPLDFTDLRVGSLRPCPCHRVVSLDEKLYFTFRVLSRICSSHCLQVLTGNMYIVYIMSLPCFQACGRMPSARGFGANITNLICQLCGNVASKTFQTTQLFSRYLGRLTQQLKSKKSSSKQ